MTEDRIRELLREMRDDAIPPDSRVRVRAAVNERIHAGRWASVLHNRWRLTAKVFATISIAVVLLLWRRWTVHETTPLAPARHADSWLEKTAAPDQNAKLPVSVPPSAKRPAPRMVRAALHKQRVHAPESGVLIRIETPDPDVVIVLVGESE